MPWPIAVHKAYKLAVSLVKLNWQRLRERGDMGDACSGQLYIFVKAIWQYLCDC